MSKEIPPVLRNPVIRVTSSLHDVRGNEQEEISGKNFA